MEIRAGEKKATYDFLSLYSKDSPAPSQIEDSRSAPRPPSSQGLFLKTQNFLQPLERRRTENGGRIDINRTAGPSAEHVLPGGIGTYSISHVRAAVKPELATCPAAAAEQKREPPEDGGAGGTYPYGGSGGGDGVAFAVFDVPPTGTGSRGQWPATFADRRSRGFGSLPPSSGNRQRQERRRVMDVASRSSDDDEEFGKREGSTLGGDLSGKVDRKSSDPSTPRSKHSATEQRRRSKINDRFQLLRELIPHSDQKRDKASFLLEVIEYIRFLQEKVQKCETSYPGWNQENAWDKVYFRSIWKNARNNSQSPIDGMADPSQVMKNGNSDFMFCGKLDDDAPLAQAVVSNAQNPTESDNVTVDVSYKPIENLPSTPVHLPSQLNLCASGGSGTGFAQIPQRLISDVDTFASQSQAQADCNTSSDVMNEREELIIDEGTINLSSIYSDGLLTTLNQALQCSGIDLSQASISVEISLGKRASGQRSNAVAVTSLCVKDLDVSSGVNRTPGLHSRAGSSGEGSEQAPKRHKPGEL